MEHKRLEETLVNLAINRAFARPKVRPNWVTSLHLGWMCGECPRTVGKFDVGYGG
jgi:hypothetical protein